MSSNCLKTSANLFFAVDLEFNKKFGGVFLFKKNYLPKMRDFFKSLKSENSRYISILCMKMHIFWLTRVFLENAFSEM